MARARFGRRGGAVGMKATRGRALSSAQTGNPIVPDRLDPRSEPLARRSQHGVQPGTGSLQWCLWGEGPGTRTGSSHLALRRAGRRAGGGDLQSGSSIQGFIIQLH